MWPVLLSYVLSFTYIAIYWNNHHQVMRTVHHVNSLILWSNLHLLFWLSLFPFVTSWAGESRFATVPMVCYSAVALMASCAYWLLEHTINLGGCE